MKHQPGGCQNCAEPLRDPNDASTMTPETQPKGIWSSDLSWSPGDPVPQDKVRTRSCPSRASTRRQVRARYVSDMCDVADVRRRAAARRRTSATSHISLTYRARTCRRVEALEGHDLVLTLSCGTGSPGDQERSLDQMPFGWVSGVIVLASLGSRRGSAQFWQPPGWCFISVKFH